MCIRWSAWVQNSWVYWSLEGINIEDHYSDYTYIHLQISTNSEETVKAKESFEAICLAMGVYVRHYHTNNGQFFERMSMQTIRDNG